MKILIAVVLAGLVSASAHAANVNLGWDPVVSNADGTALTGLAGYRLFRSATSLLGKTTDQAMADSTIIKTDIASTVGSQVTNATVTGLANGGQYFFRLTAFNTSGNQSGFNVAPDPNNPSSLIDVQVSTTIPNAPPLSACDINMDGSVNVLDVQLAVNQALGTIACAATPTMAKADINGDGSCSVLDVQRIVNGALGGPCVTGP